MISPRSFIASLASAACLALATAGVAGASQPASHSDISYHAWGVAAGLLSGTSDGTGVAADELVFDHATGTTDYTDPFGHGTRSYEYARWTSPYYSPGFGITELVSSWNADTPSGTWLQMEMRGESNAGHVTKYCVMGR